MPEVLAAILDQHIVVDMSVHDPPLDQMIAQVFEQGVVLARKRSDFEPRPLGVLLYGRGS